PATATRLAPTGQISGLGSFGVSVSISGDRALVGDPGAAVQSVFVFVRQASGAWTVEQKIATSNFTVTEHFGSAVSLSGDRALIGAWADNANGLNSGSVYVYERQASGTWTQTAKLLQPAPNAGADDNFGFSVSLEGDRALIGARNENHTN